MKIIDGEQK